MMTNLLHFPETRLTVRLRDDVPLSFLNEEFPDGIPIAPSLLSLNGRDSFEFNPNDLPDQSVVKDVGRALCSDAYPEDLLTALFRYNTVAIPVEWVEVCQ